MKSYTISSFIFVVMGALFILIPLYILPVCPLPDVAAIPHDAAHGAAQSTGKIMKCFWTARAEIGLGSVVIIIGLFMLLSKNIFVRMGLSMALVCIAVLGAAIPAILIGVCNNEMMGCNIGTKPALILLSGVLFVLAAINIFCLNKAARKF